MSDNIFVTRLEVQMLVLEFAAAFALLMGSVVLIVQSALGILRKWRWRHMKLTDMTLTTTGNLEGGESTLNEYYISLCRGLTGYYVLVLAPDEDTVRNHAAAYFGKLWCSIYTSAYFREIIRRRYPSASRVINPTTPIDLSGGWEWE